MLRLGVNIDHARDAAPGRGEPSTRAWWRPAALCERAGAHASPSTCARTAATFQERGRLRARQTLATRMNLEMANQPRHRGRGLGREADRALHGAGAARGA
jgi:hypothetical protein